MESATAFISTIPLTQVVTCVAVVLVSYYLWRRPTSFPPGPRGLPIVGIVPFIGKYPEHTFQRLSKKYGPVIAVRMGMNDFVVLNDYESITEALVTNKEFVSGRPTHPLFEVSGNGYGIGGVEFSPFLKKQRKFGLATLKGFGLGKKGMEERIFEEIFFIINALHENAGKPFDLHKLFSKAMSNNISSVVCGKRFEYSDKKFEDMIYHLSRGFNDPTTFKLNILIRFAPYLRHIPPFSTSLDKLRHDFAKVHEVLNEIIDEHRTTLDSNSPRDFIDAYLTEMRKANDPDFSEKQLIHYCFDLFLAGTDTTTSTLRWAIIILLHYPEIQKKLRHEIVATIGTESKTTMSDRAKLPYTCAFIEELFRFRSVLPLGIAHKTNGNVKIGGYNVPKDTQVLCNIWAVNNDPKLWEEPEKFDPNRFLDDEGNFVQSKNMISFSMGYRRCLGEPLARMEVFLTFVSLLQRFQFVPAPGGLPDINAGANGGAFIPSPFSVVVMEF